MSSYEDEICEQPSDNMELKEYKVDMEETSINFGCVKKELDEGEFEFNENRYKLPLTFENIFGESSIEQRDNKDNLIGFLEDEVIMETGCIKLEDIKEEEDFIGEIMEESYCNKCGGNYQGYCLDCSSLSHILNNLTPNIKPEPILNTVPINTLQIREVSSRQAVFALKTLPKGVILGPFEGVAPIESTTGLQWKIKDKKLVTDQNGNWMKYIESVINHVSKNLDVVQFDGILYFETSREIYAGEELLVCYREEKDEVLKSDNEEEFYLVPVKKEEYPKVFACTLCCLGFRLEECLMEHKSKRRHGGSSHDFEIIQCRCCKVWLEKREHLESHMSHCLENYSRLHLNYLNFQPTKIDEDNQVLGSYETTTQIDVNSTPTEKIDSKAHGDHFHGNDIGIVHSNTRERAYKCLQYPYPTNYKGNLKRLGTRNAFKLFECDSCKKKFSLKFYLKIHIKNHHLSTNEKEYKCSQCSYQTSFKQHLRIHLNKHTDSSEKCAYQTNYTSNLKEYLNTHTDIKLFQCHTCNKSFNHKSSLKLHIKASEKEYKCPDCSYETNCKSNLNVHLNTHNGIKQFQCDKCKQRFGYKYCLKLHIRNKHSNTSEMEYKCSECSYQTNYKSNLNVHLNTHDIKQFQCDECKQRFRYKYSLNVHVRNKHSNTSEKEYKCSECSFQTKCKGNLNVHLNTHSDIKPFQCDTCKMRFSQKSNLKRHTENKHLDETDY